MVKKSLYLILGYLSLALGVIGAFVPILPTVPFLLLASFCFSKGSPRAHLWLLEHKYLGPPLKAWEERGVISKKSKLLATISIALLLAYPMIALSLNLAVKAVVFALVASVLVFIWSRESEV